MSDPRIFFAAERTLLAWLRTGITIVALGFVVARFGLFLTLMAASQTASAQGARTHWPSSALGIALVLLGATTIYAALYNHASYVRSLPREDVPPLPLPWLTYVLSFTTATIGILLAAYLAFT